MWPKASRNFLCRTLRIQIKPDKNRSTKVTTQLAGWVTASLDPGHRDRASRSASLGPKPARHALGSSAANRPAEPRPSELFIRSDRRRSDPDKSGLAQAGNPAGAGGRGAGSRGRRTARPRGRGEAAESAPAQPRGPPPLPFPSRPSRQRPRRQKEPRRPRHGPETRLTWTCPRHSRRWWGSSGWSARPRPSWPYSALSPADRPGPTLNPSPERIARACAPQLVCHLPFSPGV